MMTYDYNKTSSGQNEYDTESAAPESVSANAAPAAAPENAAAQQPRVNLSGTAPAAHIPAENDEDTEVFISLEYNHFFNSNAICDYKLNSNHYLF